MGDVSPMSRDEKLLRRILGESIEIEEPQSRIEVLLKRIIDEGGVGGGSYEIKGSYATVADLEAAHPTGSAGDAYLVGDPSHVYVWLTDENAWHDGGAFSAIAGPQGNGIVSIVKTGTSGLVDTYTITYDNGDTDTFDVTNGEDGVGITDISKTSTAGLVDTYTITLSDGSTYTFTVTNGSEGTLPGGGTTGQVLAKKSNADGDVEWVDPSGGSDVSSELESLSNQTSELASETSSLSTENSTQTSEISSLSAENSTQSSELGSLSSENNSQSSELASLSSENSTQSSELSSLSATMSEVVSEISSMSVSDIASELSSLTSENSTQESEIGSLAAVDSAHTSEIGSLSQSMSELASAASSTSAAQSDIDLTQDGSISSLTSENSTQTSELGSLSTAASELASEVTVIGSEVAEKQDALVEGPGIDIDLTTNEIKTETVIFTGTLQQWEALTTEQKLAYTHAAITNDSQSGVIDLVPLKDSLHAVSSGGVYDDTYIVGHHDDASWIEVSKETSTTGKTTRMFIQDNNLKPFTQLFDSQGQQEDVDSVVIERDLDWKFVASKTGTAHIALPASFKEIWVRARKTDTIDALTWHIPGAVLTSTAVLYISGWATSAAGSYGYILASKSEVYLGAYTNNNNDITSTALVDVYYR